jgi:exodeoxyribonuclease VII large subunit
MKYKLSALRNFLSAKAGTRGFIVAETRIRGMVQRVDDLTLRLEQARRSHAFIRTKAHRVELCEQRLKAAVERALKNAHQSFARIAHTLDALSPLAVLERGYAICLTDEGRVIRSSNEVQIDSGVKVRLHEGSLSAKVVSKE